jgi:hypothetical protein
MYDDLVRQTNNRLQIQMKQQRVDSDKKSWSNYSDADTIKTMCFTLDLTVLRGAHAKSLRWYFKLEEQ